MNAPRPRARQLAVAALVALCAACRADFASPHRGALLAADRAALDLGLHVVLFDDATADTLVVRNDGDAISAPLDVGLAPAGTTAGVLLDDPAAGGCRGRRLAPGATCRVVVSLGGLGSGPQQGAVVVRDGVGGPDSLAIPLSGVIRSALTIYYSGAGHGSVAAVPASVACVGSTCSTGGPGAVCRGTCTLFFDTPTATLLATEDADGSFAGFIDSAEQRCGEPRGNACALRLIDLNAVGVVFDRR